MADTDYSGHTTFPAIDAFLERTPKFPGGGLDLHEDEMIDLKGEIRDVLAGWSFAVRSMVAAEERAERDTRNTDIDMSPQQAEPAEQPYQRGWWGMYCFNGLSPEQQKHLVEWGNLAIGYQPQGSCRNGARVEVTTIYDEMPGPRFYCLACAVGYLEVLNRCHPG